MSRERAKELGIEPVETVEAMLPRVDYLTVHTPLTDETRGLIGPAQIEKMKPGVRLINAARGGIYDEAALAEGLKAGKLAGVALDVFAIGAMHRQPAVRPARRRLHASLGREHRRSPNASRDRGGRAVGRVSDDRRDPARGQRRVARSENAGLAARLPGCRLSVGHAAGRDGARRAAVVPAAVSRRDRRQEKPRF